MGHRTSAACTGAAAGNKNDIRQSHRAMKNNPPNGLGPSMVGASNQPSQRALTLDACLRRGQPNNFDFLRLFSACLVLFGHSFTLLEASPAERFPHDPATLLIFKYMPFGQGLPGTGLHIFFFISGLLVTLSFLNHRKNPLLFVQARVLRIICPVPCDHIPRRSWALFQPIGSAPSYFYYSLVAGTPPCLY
jgi:Acyltransferase family